MSRLVRGFLPVSLALASLCSTTPAIAAHYRVYFLGGQSNGNGRGDAAQLLPPLSAAQTDVAFYWHRTQAVSNAGWILEDQWTDLAPGSGHGTTNPVFAKEFGSEVAFGRAMADADPSVNIAVVKYTHGGTNLHTQWSATGDMYATFVATAQAALTALTSNGDTYEFGGMIWHQGEADTGGAADQYEANLTSLVNRVRQDVFGGEVAPFVVGSLSDSQYGSQITTPGTGAYKVRQAQEAVAANMVQVGFVNTDGFDVRSGDTIHFDHNGQIALGQGFASQMLALEANDPDRDGLLNDEEATLGTDPNNADTDGDGQGDAFEVGAGTDPVSGTSFFAITDFDLTGNQVTLTWPSLAGNSYDIERSTNLATWSTVESGYPASDPGSTTNWSASLDSMGGGGESSPGVLARYDAQEGTNGDFNSAAFDSVDTDIVTTANRLVQGGGLTGGGAAAFVLENTLFDSGESGSPGFNLADVTTASQATAAAAGDYFSFTIESGGDAVVYESLSFYSNQYATTGVVDVSYTTTGGGEVFVVQGLVPTVGNAAVSLEEIDFPDFVTTEDVTWTFYLYGASTSTHGTRFDDITLFGHSAGNLISNFTFTGPPWTAAKEPDFATFAASAPSADTDPFSTTSILTNSGYTGGGYASFYIRDIDGGTIGVPDGGDYVIFSTSATPGVGMNFAGANQTVPTNYLAFTVTPDSGYQTTFESLSFYTDCNFANEEYNVQLAAWDGSSLTVLGDVSHTSGASTNEPVVFKSIDFPDFTSTGPIEFRLSGYDMSAANGGIRLDDIRVQGVSNPTAGTDPAAKAYFRVRLLP
ncbi:hypothetical protein HAHE_18830 [Haloferula helveola]|uniref:Sialate O-acetylesterase domain-containing protein n=1 Tax=Haloferula helveola TaxID=490095 RepID=A0ABN6H917_9BACT|nr:hypothetical protein HAHE_18830 [Haloferula helveola]